MSGHAIHIKIDGRTYSGTYALDRKVLAVKTQWALVFAAPKDHSDAPQHF